MIKKIAGKIFHILNILIIALSIVIGIITIFDKQIIIDLIKKLEVLIEGLGSWNYFIAFISSAIEAFPLLGVVVPGQNILLIVGGFFAKISIKNLIYIYFIASIGAILGNYIGYILGKKYGDSFFEQYGIWFGVGLTEVKYLKKSIDKWGAWGIILGKFHPITRSFLPFIAGSMGMKSFSFMIYNIIGSIIRSITIISLGVLFSKYYELVIENIGKIMIVVFLFIAFYIYKFKREEFKKYMKEKEQEISSKQKI